MPTPYWDFPPSNGGLHYDLSDAASAHFQTDRISHVVREALQNSLDAHDSGFPAVEVLIEERKIPKTEFGGADLLDHLQACLDESEQSVFSNSELEAELLKRAISTLRHKNIRCLAIIDSGTHGLRPENWRALVESEAAVMKQGGAPGGSRGIGKSAALTVSDLLTVFYSTRYLAGRKGRIEQAQGRSRLMTHRDPNPRRSLGRRRGDYLQHVGFYRNRDHSPMMGVDIPDCFRLADATGTGIFILGFNPHAENWVTSAEQAVCASFFHAIHNKKLVVTIDASEPKKKVCIDHQNLDGILSKYTSHTSQNSLHYCRAIRDQPAPYVTRKRGPLGSVNMYLNAGEGPSRVAYVNRKGMLITDKTDQSINPFAPRRRSIWSDYTAVIIADSDEGDTWIRSMEDPAHESINPSRLQSDNEQQKASSVFGDVRKQIRGIIESEMNMRYDDLSENLVELADFFPEDRDTTSAEQPVLTLTRVPTRFDDRTASTAGSSTSFDETTNDSIVESEDESDTDETSETEQRDRQASESNRERDRSRRLDLLQPRVIRKGPHRLQVSFGLTAESAETFEMSLHPRGYEPVAEPEIVLREVATVHPDTASCTLDPQGRTVRIRVGTNDDERVRLGVTTADSVRDVLAFDIRVRESA